MPCTYGFNLTLAQNANSLGIQNAVSVAIPVSVMIGKNRLNAEIASRVAVRMRFGQLKNLSAISS